MTTLSGQTPASSFQKLLQVDNVNGIDSTMRNIEDGEGTVSPVYVSTMSMAVVGNVGINHITPTEPLHLKGDGSQTILSESYGAAPKFSGAVAAGTTGTPTAILNGTTILDNGVVTHHGAAFHSTASVALKGVTTEDHTLSACGARWEFQTVENLSTTLITRLMIDHNGNVGVGSSTPSASAALDINSTTGALLLPRMTTTERNALAAVNGMLIYNTTDNKFQGYENGAWANLI